MSVRETVDPERFRDDLEGWLAWAEENWKAGQGWCPRHWSPAPVEGRNGIVASLAVLAAALEELAPKHVRRSSGRSAAPALNAWLAKLEKPLCCLLGDDRVAAIWIEAGKSKTDNAA